MFDPIAGRYDLLNRLLSLGLDRHWRRRLVDSLGLAAVPGAPVLDLATGTADVALAIAEAKPHARVVGVDPSPRMLQHAATKIAARRLEHRIRLTLGDGLELPFGPGCFAASCISFGIRNVADRLGCLRELRRVTRTDGVIAVLELAEPRRGWIAPLARWHVRHVVPVLGRLLSGAEAYAYLQRSIAAFPAPEMFTALMGQAGLRDAAALPMSFGAVYLFTARA